MRGNHGVDIGQKDSKNRQAIHGALMELIQEKELSRITVKELVEQANVNSEDFLQPLRQCVRGGK